MYSHTSPVAWPLRDCMCVGVYVTAQGCCQCCTVYRMLHTQIALGYFLSTVSRETVAEGHLRHTSIESSFNFNRVHEWFSGGKFAFLYTLLQQWKASPTYFIPFLFLVFRLTANTCCWGRSSSTLCTVMCWERGPAARSVRKQCHA